MPWCIHGMGMLLLYLTLTNELLGVCRNLPYLSCTILFKETSIAHTTQKGYSWPETMYWPWLMVKVTSSLWKRHMQSSTFYRLFFVLVMYWIAFFNVYPEYTLLISKCNPSYTCNMYLKWFSLKKICMLSLGALERSLY